MAQRRSMQHQAPRTFEITNELIARVLGLVSSSSPLPEYPHKFANAFETVGSEILMRAQLAATHNMSSEELRQQARLFNYVSYRLQDVFARLSQLKWMRDECKKKLGDEARMWNTFAGLAIKDFHIDVGSVMDAVAPAILQVSGAFEARGSRRKLPGFADIQEPGSDRSAGFRSRLPNDVRNVVDSSNAWWPYVKAMRDALAHREHHKIVFGNAQIGVLFQIYEPALKPLVVDPRFRWKEGRDVADFRKYSAAVFCRLALFLDELGRVVAGHVGVEVDRASPLMRCGDFADLIESLESFLNTGTQAAL